MYKVTYSNHSDYEGTTIYFDNIGDIACDLENEKVGSKVTADIEVVELTDEEYQNLPDFAGW
jgi:hypothetical protein